MWRICYRCSTGNKRNNFTVEKSKTYKSKEYKSGDYKKGSMQLSYVEDTNSYVYILSVIISALLFVIYL